MIETFLASSSPMLILFICALAGYLLRKFSVVPDNTDTVISRLETFAIVPALSFSSFSTYCTIDSLKENWSLFLYGGLAIGFSIALSYLLIRFFPIKNDYTKCCYKYALAFSNFGYVGNAVVPMLLGGDEHLYLYLLFTICLSFVVYLWGFPILTPKESRPKNPIMQIFTVPMIAIFVGVFFGLTGLGQKLPGFLVSAIDSIKNCMGPLAMILTGFVIGGYRFKELLNDPKVFVVSLLRLTLLPALIVVFLYFCGASTYVMTLAFFAFGTPLGLNTVVFPAAFGGETKTGASMAMISTVLSVFTLPVMYALLQAVIAIL